MTVQLRNGTAAKERKFISIVNLGHSYGSTQLQVLSAFAPDLLLRLTSLKVSFLLASPTAPAASRSSSWTPPLRPVIMSFPQRFNNISEVYLVSGSSAAGITLFLWLPNFDANVADVAQAEYADALTLGTLSSMASVQKPASDFMGSVFVVSGEQNLAFCQGNCHFAIIKSLKDSLYPQAGNFSSYIEPQSGHSLVVGYSSPDSNQRIVQFFIDNSFGSTMRRERRFSRFRGLPLWVGVRANHFHAATIPSSFASFKRHSVPDSYSTS